MATLELVEDELMHNTNETGSYAQVKLREIMQRHPQVISDVRGFGLMIGVEIAERQWESNKRSLRDQMLDLAFEGGLLLLGCGKNVIRIVPPLIVSPSQIDEGLSIFEDVVRELE
jgi:4-aminobutyrate aminotransferase